MMKGLSEGKPIDPNTYSVLNGKSLTKSSLVGDGIWNFGQVFLDHVNPNRPDNNLRLRGSVGVDVQS
jgi:hypothetical protein